MGFRVNVCQRGEMSINIENKFVILFLCLIFNVVLYEIFVLLAGTSKAWGACAI